jgi:hypothetical protein
MIPPSFWPVARAALVDGQIPAEAHRAFLTDAALLLGPGDARPGHAQAPALAGWLAGRGADPHVYRSLARRLLDRSPSPKDEAEWIALLVRLPGESPGAAGGLAPEAVHLLAGCAPRPDDPPRARAEWEAMVVEVVSRPGPAWRIDLACYLLVGLIDGRAGDPGRWCATLARLGPEAMEPSAWGADLELLGLRLRHDPSPSAGTALLDALRRLLHDRRALPEEERMAPDEVAAIVASLRGSLPPPVRVSARPGSEPHGERSAKRAALSYAALGLLPLAACVAFVVWRWAQRADFEQRYRWDESVTRVAPRTESGKVPDASLDHSADAAPQGRFHVDLKDTDLNHPGTERYLRLFRETGEVWLHLVFFPAGRFHFSVTDRVEPVPAFALGKAEVTREQYAFVMGEAALVCLGVGERSAPVTGVTWTQAVEFCRAVQSNCTGDLITEVRLPDQLQWEYAAKKRSFAEQLNESALHEPNLKAPCTRNLEGAQLGVVFDLAGNVKEWMNDIFADPKAVKFAGPLPRGPQTGNRRVVRGGCYLDERSERVLTRVEGREPDSTDKLVGFRVLVILKPS